MLPVNNNLHRYSACAIQRNCVVCVNAIENEEHLLFACPLYNGNREKLLNDTSQNTVTASLENVLSWKSKTNIISIGQICFQHDQEKKRVYGVKLVLRYSIVHNRLVLRCLLLVHLFYFILRLMCICTDFKLDFNLYWGLWPICN